MNDRTFSHSSAHKLEDPARLTWLPPAQVVAALGLRQGMHVADIGAGTGYFALPMSAAVGDSGHIYAIDLQPEMLAKIEAKVQASGTRNISLHTGDATQVPLADACCELILLANIWHELDEHGAVLKEARRLLSPQGRVAILDWRAELETPPGPPRHHRISAQSVADFLQQHGLEAASRQDIGEFSYLVIASAL